MVSAPDVVFVAHTARVSGAERMLLDVVSEAVEQGVDVAVACPEGALSQALPSAVRHLSIPDLGLGGQRGLARVVAAARMATQWARAGRTLRAASRSSSTRVIVNSLFALPATRLAGPRGGATWLVHDAVASRRQDMVTKACRRVVRKAVACTRAAAAPVAALGFPVDIVPYGVQWPVPKFGGALHDPPVVVVLALLTPWKGHDVLLDAIASVPGVVVRLAGATFPGDRDYEEQLRSRSARPDLAGRVEFLGHVDPEETLRGADVVVSSSVLPEAGPLAVLEAMAHGLPVIATDHGGPPEFFAPTDGRSDAAGVLVPPGDPAALASALREVLSNDVRRARLADAARRAIADEHDASVTRPMLLKALIE